MLVLAFGQHAEPHAKFDGTFTTCNQGGYWSFVVPAAATKESANFGIRL